MKTKLAGNRGSEDDDGSPSRAQEDRTQTTSGSRLVLDPVVSFLDHARTRTADLGRSGGKGSLPMRLLHEKRITFKAHGIRPEKLSNAEYLLSLREHGGPKESTP